MIEPVRATEGFSSSPILFNAPPPLSAPRAPFSFASFESVISSNYSLFEGNHESSGFAHNPTILAVAPQLHVASQASFSCTQVGSIVSNNNLFQGAQGFNGFGSVSTITTGAPPRPPPAPQAPFSCTPFGSNTINNVSTPCHSSGFNSSTMFSTSLSLSPSLHTMSFGSKPISNTIFDSSMQFKYSRRQQSNFRTMPHYPPITTTEVPLLSTIFTQSQCLFGGQDKNASHNIVPATAINGSLKYETVDMKLPIAFSACDALSSSIEPLAFASRIQTEAFELKSYEVPEKSTGYDQKYYSQDSLQKMISSANKPFRNDRKFRRSTEKTSDIDRSRNRISMAHKMDAEIQSPKQQDLLLLDVTPLSLGIEGMNGHMCIIISRNRTIPCRTEFYSAFTNAYAYQTTAMIRVFCGEHKLTKYNVSSKMYISSKVILKGATNNAKINFTSESQIYKDFTIFDKMKQIDLTTLMMNELKRIQLVDGSFDLNQDLADLLSLSVKDFDKQGFNSFVPVPVSERNELLVPFDSKQIQLIFHRHLPKALLENLDKMIHFYEQKRLSNDIYCAQLELKYSSWEKFIQYALFHIDI
ncbi:unnamed protein product [Rotaria magnacalcarata]|uniref:Uncharacterized protein n=1 Tax=Rotaria magnacalcarata TaxID=392030 RepID=A0A816LPA8_9BILA|nr:unnamed protein product [Rotaria magnacalcarata]CAF3792113.1 unnamed protein product [Rotaria magnacalcarata]